MPTKCVIDPGHGGTAEIGGSSPNNATGPTGLLEKNLTLDVALRVLSRNGGLDIALTRIADNNLGLAARAGVAKAMTAPVFVSVHFNGWQTQDVQGTETYVHNDGSAASLRLAKQVHAKVRAATTPADRGLKRAAFAVLAPANHNAATAACLVEISFLTQAAEETRLKTSAYLDRLADAMVAGIQAFLTQPVLEGAAPTQRIQDLPSIAGTEDAAGTNLRSDQ